jgi:hypothetical protein
MTTECTNQLITAAETAKKLCELVTQWASAEKGVALEIMDKIGAIAHDNYQPAVALDMVEKEAAGEYPHKRFSAPYWQTRHSLALGRIQGLECDIRRIDNSLAGDLGTKAYMIRRTCKAALKNAGLEE